MGGLMHLFDFNQALAGRKLLSNKKSGAEKGLDAQGNGLDVRGSVSEVPKTDKQKNDEVWYAYQAQKASNPKKSNGMPIKALIARDLTKGSGVRSKSPSVVARLMGLEALPSESKSLPKTSTGNIMRNIDEKPVHKSNVEKQHQDDKFIQNARLYSRKDKKSAVPGQLSSRSLHLQQSDAEDDRHGLESLPFRNHPQEQQLQEFKKEFEARQSQKLPSHRKRSAKHAVGDPHMSGNQNLMYEKQHKVRPPMTQDKYGSSRMGGPQERLQESREFQDAMEFLQSNKEFFMKFLQQSDSLFARHLRENDTDGLLPSDAIQVVKPRRMHKALEDTRESPMSRLNCRSDMLPNTTEEAVLDFNGSSSFGSEDSAEFQDRYKHVFPPLESEKRLHNSEYQVPTRIVVLKPSPGRVRNLKSPSPTYSRSPRDHSVIKEVTREDSTDVLEKLREKLRKDSSKEYKQDKRNTPEKINDHYKDAFRDPREIAKEIARQVRESVTRDLMVGSMHSKSKRFTVNDRNSNRRNRHTSEVGDSPGNTHNEASAHPSKLYWETYQRPRNVLSPKDKTINVEVLDGYREEKINGVAQLKTKFGNHSKETHLQSHDMLMKNQAYYENSSHASSPEPEASTSPQGSGSHSLDAFNVGQKYRRALFLSPTQKVEDSRKISPGLESEAFHSINDEQIKLTPMRKLESLSVTSSDVDQRQQGNTEPSTNSLDLLEADLEPTSTTVTESVKPIVLQQAVDLSIQPASPSSLKQDTVAEEVDPIVTEDECYKAEEPIEGLAVSHENELSCNIHNYEAVGEDFSESLSEPVTPVAQSQAQKVMLDGETDLEVSDDPKCQAVELDSDLQPEEVSTPCSFSHGCLRNVSGNSEVLLDSMSSSDNNSLPVKEQAEQPSPISVLDFAFEEHTTIPNELQDINADLQELRSHLRLLKFDGCKDDFVDDSKVEVTSIAEEEIEREDPDLQNEKLLDSLIKSEEFDCITCLPGKESEMSYVKYVLASSGFIGGDSSTVLAKWYAPSQPLNPSLFQNIETSYLAKVNGLLDQSHIVSTVCKDGEVLERSLRHLIFDGVNEVLCDVLGHHLHRRLSSRELTVFPMPCGSDLLKHVWLHVSSRLNSHSGSQDTLENLVTKDLSKGGSWFDMGVEIETVCLDIERSILDDLIEETLLIF